MEPWQVIACRCATDFLVVIRAATSRTDVLWLSCMLSDCIGCAKGHRMYFRKSTSTPASIFFWLEKIIHQCIQSTCCCSKPVPSPKRPQFLFRSNIHHNLNKLQKVLQASFALFWVQFQQHSCFLPLMISVHQLYATSIDDPNDHPNETNLDSDHFFSCVF